MAVIPDINDDLQRETSFYERALASAELAVSKLKALGVATRRPDDFYAEMVKSDEHMKRVRAELIFEQTKQETTDERRKAREEKKLSKGCRFRSGFFVLFPPRAVAAVAVIRITAILRLRLFAFC